MENEEQRESTKKRETVKSVEDDGPFQAAGLVAWRRAWLRAVVAGSLLSVVSGRSGWSSWAGSSLASWLASVSWETRRALERLSVGTWLSLWSLFSGWSLRSRLSLWARHWDLATGLSWRSTWSLASVATDWTWLALHALLSWDAVAWWLSWRSLWSWWSLWSDWSLLTSWSGWADDADLGRGGWEKLGVLAVRSVLSVVSVIAVLSWLSLGSGRSRRSLVAGAADRSRLSRNDWAVSAGWSGGAVAASARTAASAARSSARAAWAAAFVAGLWYPLAEEPTTLDTVGVALADLQGGHLEPHVARAGLAVVGLDHEVALEGLNVVVEHRQRHHGADDGDRRDDDGHKGDPSHLTVLIGLQGLGGRRGCLIHTASWLFGPRFSRAMH